MSEPPHLAGKSRHRWSGWVLACVSFVAMVFALGAFLPHGRAGGSEVTAVGLLTNLACAVISSLCFTKCPRRSYLSKFLTFILLWPSLRFAVDVVTLAIGRCFDPGFGLC